MIGGRSVDASFWRGSPNPTLVQRIAAWLFGIMLFLPGLLIVSMGKAGGPWLIVIIGWGAILLGAQTLRNGFARRGPVAKKEDNVQ